MCQIKYWSSPSSHFQYSLNGSCATICCLPPYRQAPPAGRPRHTRQRSSGGRSGQGSSCPDSVNEIGWHTVIYVLYSCPCSSAIWHLWERQETWTSPTMCQCHLRKEVPHDLVLSSALPGRGLEGALEVRHVQDVPGGRCAGNERDLRKRLKLPLPIPHELIKWMPLWSKETNYLILMRDLRGYINV